MRKIYLYGQLGEEFGDVLDMDVASVSEAIRMLEVNFPGKFCAMLENGSYYVVLGKDLDGQGIVNPELLDMKVGEKDIHIVPEAVGAGGNRKGFLGIIVGVVLIAAAFWTGGASLAGFAGSTATIAGFSVQTVALFGAAMLFSGLSAVLTKPPSAGDYGDREAPDQKKSFLFNGAQNNTEQGGPVPLIYGGPIIVGSHVISGSLRTEKV